MRARFVPRGKKKSFNPFSLLSVRSLIQGQQPDHALLMCVFGLLVFGWVSVYSASALFAEARYQDQFFFLKRQILWSLIGIFFFLVSCNTPTTFWQRNTKPLYVFTCLSLVLVLIFGPEIAGAKRWLRIGPFGVQPSEFAKLFLIFVVADYLDRRQSRLRDFKKGLVPLLTVIGVPILLILVEPDLGTPVLMGGTILCLLILGGARIKHFLIMSFAALPFLVLAIYSVRYRLDRFFAYLDPWSDPHGSGYQLIQSLLALGSGGFLGQGLGSSKIKIAHLPDAHTDFVFSVIGEELGLVGTLICVALFFFITIRGLKIAKSASTTFSSLLAAGISLTIGFQSLINMGVASGLFPTKGMPLPFLSFGGSSLLVCLISVGILARVSKESRKPSDSGGS